MLSHIILPEWTALIPYPQIRMKPIRQLGLVETMGIEPMSKTYTTNTPFTLLLSFDQVSGCTTNFS